MTTPVYSYTYTPPAVETGIDGFAFNAESLSPEGLLIYCQTQLGSLDDDIKAYMQQQRDSMAKKKVLQELKKELMSNNPTSDAGDNSATHQKIADAHAKAYEDLSNPEHPAYDPGLAAQVKEQFYALFPGGDIKTANKGDGSGAGSDGDNNVPSSSTDNWQSKIDVVTNMIDDLNGNAELGMIQLQSIMSQRQTAIQLTTSMMDKYHKGLDQIAANFK